MVVNSTLLWNIGLLTLWPVFRFREFPSDLEELLDVSAVWEVSGRPSSRLSSGISLRRMTGRFKNLWDEKKLM